MENYVKLGLIIKDLKQNKVYYSNWKKYLFMYIEIVYIEIMLMDNISKEILLKFSQSLIDAEVICLYDTDEKSVKNLRLLLNAINLKINNLPVKKTPITLDTLDASEFDERGFRKPETYWTDSQKQKMLGIGKEIYQQIPDKICIDKYKPKMGNPIAESLDEHKDLEKKLMELSGAVENLHDSVDLFAGKKRR